MGGGLKGFEEFMKELPRKLQQAKELVLERAGAIAVSQISKAFKTEGKSIGQNWAELNPKYLRWKIKKGLSEKKLHRTTTLAQSFTYKTTQNAAVIGTPVQYAIYHEYGTKHMPARPFMRPVARWLAEKELKNLFMRTFKEVL